MKASPRHGRPQHPRPPLLVRRRRRRAPGARPPPRHLLRLHQPLLPSPSGPHRPLRPPVPGSVVHVRRVRPHPPGAPVHAPLPFLPCSPVRAELAQIWASFRRPRQPSSPAMARAKLAA
ncbi:hypothetical protein NL676_008337 [Syzygium grande]|nr:hypothetical protein NL676_008337 [Syzygium grande]